LKNISRSVHLFSVAYIVGQSFSIFIMGPEPELRIGYGSAYVLEMIFLTLMLITGLTNWVININKSSPKRLGIKRYHTFMGVKVLLFIFITPVTDVIVMAAMGKVDQVELSNAELYFVKSVKFCLILAAFAIGSYQRVYREEITKDFSQLSRTSESPVQ